MKKISSFVIIGILFLLLGLNSALGFNENARTILDNTRDVTINYNTCFIEPVEELNKTFGGIKWDECSAIELTSDGGYVLGGTIDANGYDDNGDCWLFKIDSYGNLEWENTYGGHSSEMGVDICKTSDGGYAFIGCTRSFGSGGGDFYLIKTDAIGIELWNKTFGGPGYDHGLAIQACSDSGFIIAGATQSFGANEAWLIKTDETGNLQWEKRFCGSRPPGGYFMTVLETSEGDYVAAGRNYLGDTSDIIVVKTDEYGNVIWEELLGNQNYKESAMDIIETDDGNYVVTGQILNADTDHDILLMKIDDDGNEIWTQIFIETPFFDTGLSLEKTSDGGFLVAGEIGTNLNNPVMFDSILIKTNSMGNKEWSMRLGGSGSDSFYEALQTIDGGYIAAGFTTSYGLGSQDAWVIKLANFENQIPNKPLRPTGITEGSINNEYTYSTTAVDPDGDVLFYLFFWDDGTDSGWLGPYSSGEECNASHTWMSKGNYNIKVKAKDINGAESDWSDPLPISMPRNRFLHNSFILKLFERFQIIFHMFQYILRI